MSSNEIIYKVGIPEEFRSTAVNLYDEAFGKKISVAVKDKKNRLQLLNNSLVLKFAIGAFTNKKLVGIAGFQTFKGSLTSGIGYRDLISQLGFIKGNWSALIFSLYERKPKQGELVMDGIAVHSEGRGKGIGTNLLKEIKKYGEIEGFNQVRLDVINTNPKAKKLYENIGYKSIKTVNFPYLEKLLGFSGVTTMISNIDKTISNLK